MRRRKLEMLISSLDGIKDPSPELEQYPTPSSMCAEILYYALGKGDIIGRSIIDLGCGNGLFAIGAWVLGASRVVGVDIDKSSLDTASRNLRRVKSTIDPLSEAPISFFDHDVRSPFPIGMEMGFDTALMNPPFGAQNRHADRPFVERALEAADICYSIHNGGSMPFLERLAASLDADIELLWKDGIELPAMFSFHRKERYLKDVVVVRLETVKK